MSTFSRVPVPRIGLLSLLLATSLLPPATATASNETDGTEEAEEPSTAPDQAEEGESAGEPTAIPELSDNARAALRRGDCDALTRAIEDREDPAAQLHRVRCGADPALLEPMLDRDDLLGHYARLLRAPTLREESPEAVAPLLEGLDLPGAAGREVQLQRALAQLAGGDTSTAIQGLGALNGTDREDEAIYWIAMANRQDGNEDACIDKLERLWADRVTSPYSTRAAEVLSELGRAVPRSDNEAGQGLIHRRARALIAAARAPEALPLYALLDAAGFSEGPAWTLEMAMAFFRAKQYPEAVSRMLTLDPTNPEVEGGQETTWNYAVALTRSGDYDAAITVYRAYIRNWPGLRRADLASYKLGFLLYDRGELEDGLAEMQAHLVRHPRSRHASNTRWFVAWSLYRLGRFQEAAVAFQKIRESHSNSSLVAGADYWLARLKGRSEGEEAERLAMAAMLDQHPKTGWAWFAARQLNVRFEGLGNPEVPPLSDELVANSEDLSNGMELLSLGLGNWARDWLLQGKQTARSAGREATLSVAHALIEAGAYREARRLAGPWCDQEPRDALAEQACHPRPERPVVEEATSEAGIPSLLPYAIMLAESALDPEVTSAAGARGLMQLMPSLGEELHATLQPDVPYDPDRLYQPGYNAWFGTTELGRLRCRLEPMGVTPWEPLAIAGYNAGPHNVERWIGESDPAGEADVFMENIGYTETRRYVRRVLGHLMAWRMVYGDGALSGTSLDGSDSGDPSPSVSSPQATEEETPQP